MNILCWLQHPQVREWSLSEAQSDRLRTLLPEALVRTCESLEAFLEALPEAEVALVWRFRQDWFAQAPRLRLLSTPAAGHEYLDVIAPPKVRVCFGAFHGAIMAETVLAALLGFTRGLLQHAAAMRVPRSEHWPRDRFTGTVRRLAGTHLAIVGMGHIGSWVARLAKPFGVRVTGFRRRPPSELPAFLDAGDRLLPVGELDAVLPSVDHLVLALPAAPDTDRMFDARRLALLPRHAVLVSVGRGTVLDEAALATALKHQGLAAALLDVFGSEPLATDSPLRGAPNCLLYPHVSAIAPDYLDLYLEQISETIRGLQSAGQMG